MGIVEDNDELLVDLHLKRVQTLCRTWLLSILQNLVAIAIVLAISWRHDSRDLFLEKAAAGAAIHLATLAFGMVDRKSTRLNSSHRHTSRMPSSA